MPADSTDLVASTGVNDPGSPWTSLLQTALTDATQYGSSALTNALSSQTPLTGSTNGSGGPTPSTSGSPAGQVAQASAAGKSTIMMFALLVAGLIAWVLFKK